MSDHKRKIALVTGASSGIGQAIAQSLLAEGYSVVGTGRDFAKASFNHDCFSEFTLDFAASADLPAKLKSLQNHIQQLDGDLSVLVNNAGVGKMAYLEQLSPSDIIEQMNVNFVSHALLTRAFLASIKKNAGDIVFIGSEAGLKGAQQGSIYCASKFALRGFSQALRQECSKSNVRVSLINPGAVRSDFFDLLDYEPGHESDNAIDPQLVADTAMMVIKSPAQTNYDEINLTPLKRVWKRK